MDQGFEYECQICGAKEAYAVTGNHPTHCCLRMVNTGPVWLYVGDVVTVAGMTARVVRVQGNKAMLRGGIVVELPTTLRLAPSKFHVTSESKPAWLSVARSVRRPGLDFYDKA